MKHIVVLGSTGSIGKSALDIIWRNPGEFRVTGLSTNSDIDTLQEQINKFHPLFVCVKEKKSAERLKIRLNCGIKIFSGEEGLLELLENKQIDTVVMAVSGTAALGPVLKTIETGKTIALANKEALVMAGPIIMDRAAKKKVKILPIDSEQSAIWQCLNGNDKTKVRNIYLTASGGPFRKFKKAEFKKITVKDTLKHPRWKMGEKITVDSATLMNKGLELLETVYLFTVPAEKIKIVIHPEAIIHSMVEYIDGSVAAQLSITDMRIPIQYALSYPRRLENNSGRLDFYKLGQLNFERPDFRKFPCLESAYRAAELKGTMPCVLNAANEVCVHEFLKERLKFVSIPLVIEKVLDRHNNKQNPDLDDILEADNWARRETLGVIDRYY